MRLFADGLALMRERIGVYAGMALLCAIAGAFGASGLLEAAARPDAQSTVLGALFAVPGLRAVLLGALLALFFILPSALRRLQPGFRMTPGRILVTFLMLFSVGLATEIGFAALFLPGIVIGVLVSQALFNALLSDRAGGCKEVLSGIAGAFARSTAMTKEHFMSTLGVVALSLVILLVPFFIVFVGMMVLIGWNPRSLIFTAPVLFLTFVYFECVRYVLITRWYARLETETRKK